MSYSNKRSLNMAIKPVCKMGCAALAKPSLPVQNVKDESILALIQDMYDTLQKEHGVGIAAPQIGVTKRVIIVGFEADENFPEQDAIPLTILINPTLEIL